MDCVISILSSYNGQSPSSVKNALEDYFTTDSKLLAASLQGLFTYIRMWSPQAKYLRQNSGEGFCDGAVA